VINRDRIFTAGHCVHAGNNSQSGWSTNMQFCPSYNKNGMNAAVGCWSIVRLGTSNAWFSSSDFDRDWGGGKVASCGNVNCKNIGDVTGWLGYAWNFNNEHIVDLGYPQAAPFTGKRLVACAGEVSYRVDMGAGADSKYIGCDMTAARAAVPGSSRSPTAASSTA
jgi:V8-like Glu-specific endopeptidase